MNKFTILLIVVALLLSLYIPISTAQQGDVSVKFQTKYLGFEKNYNSYKILVNVSMNKPGHVVYVEEYYTMDSNSNPKFSTSTRFDGGDLVKNKSSYNASFVVLRPVPHGGKSYTHVKAVVLLDNDRVFEYWLTKDNNFVDNTGTGDDSSTILTDAQNIDKYETRERTLITGVPVTFEYQSLGIIYAINATGKRNGEVSLRVDLLKGRPGTTDTHKGIVYKYAEIGADSNKVGNISVRYRVENTWMKERNISERYVGFIRWNATGKKWDLMPSKVLDKDGKYTYYESTAPGLSVFAIIGSPTLKKTPAANSTGSSIDPQNNTIPGVKNVPGFGIILALAVFIFAKIKKTGGNI